MFLSILYVVKRDLVCIHEIIRRDLKKNCENHAIVRPRIDTALSFICQ